MEYTYCVITGIPDAMTGDDGNLYHASLISREQQLKYPWKPTSDIYIENHNQTKVRPLNNRDLRRINRGSLKLPVFELGEIVILSRPGGREVDGMRRKPSKWFVEQEEFQSIDKAVKRAQKVLEDAQSQENY